MHGVIKKTGNNFEHFVFETVFDLQDWKDCLAVEMLNEPILSDAPPSACDVVETNIMTMPFQRLLSPECELLQIHVYEEVPVYREGRLGSKFR